MRSPFAHRETLFIAVFLLVVLAFVATFRMGVVRGDSMEPTYSDGRIVLVRRRNRFSGPLRRGDVVLVNKDHDVIIKRIYRLPGEEIDDQAPARVLSYSEMNSVLDYYEQRVESTSNGPITHYIVPDDYIVLLGDNLRVSEDSRTFGPVPIHDVLGVVARAPGPPYILHPASASEMSFETGQNLARRLRTRIQKD